jgi:hypothetical protein
MMKTLASQLLSVALLSALTLTLAACNGSNSDTATSQTGTLNLGITDAPLDSATAVVVAFSGVEVHGPDGTKTFKFDSPKTIDLLKYQGANAATLIDGATLTAGDYQWIRLDIDAADSYITLDDGTRHDLTIPSGAETGLKLVSGFTVPVGGAADFTIDFNLRKSVNAPTNPSTTAYMLRPALRLINNVKVGTIKGTVANSLTIGTLSIADATCGPAVYIYSGANAITGDVNTSTTAGVQPLDSAMLKLNNTTGAYDYSIGFVAAGDYTLAVTCAKLDAPDQADTLNFSATKTVTVTANETSTVNFQ